MLVYQLGQTTGDALDPRKVVNSGAGYRLQAAELAQQFPPPFGTHTGYAFERRSRALFAPPRPVTGNRESVRLIPQLLDKVQRR